MRSLELRPGDPDLVRRVERDTAELARIDLAVARYGKVVTPHRMEVSRDVLDLAARLRSEGLQPIIVGGSVRDSLVDGRAPKDIDIEVYGGTAKDVIRALSGNGFRVDTVGASFGVLKTVLPSGEDIDISLPRRDSKQGIGHRGFEIQCDPDMTVHEAAERRDFTINAMGYDPELEVVIDPVGGRSDMEAKVLRHVSAAFAEDPLRVLRAMQFAGRFDLDIDPDTAALCASLKSEADTLPIERRRVEWEKWATKSVSPSKGIEVLCASGWDETVPGLPDAARSSRSAVDRLSRMASDREVPRATMLPAVIAAAMPDREARSFLDQAVVGSKEQRAAFGASRGLDALPVDESTARAQALSHRGRLRDRIAVAIAQGHDDKGERAWSAAEAAGVLDGPERDLLTGDDVLSAAGRKPGPWVGEIVQRSRVAQAAREFTDRESALRWLDGEFSSIE